MTVLTEITSLMQQHVWHLRATLQLPKQLSVSIVWTHGLAYGKATTLQSQCVSIGSVNIGQIKTQVTVSNFVSDKDLFYIALIVWH